VWFSGADEGGQALFAAPVSGRIRVLQRSPDELTLHDATPDGRLLESHGTFRLSVAVKVPGADLERDLSWMGTSFATDLSADGRHVLFMEQRGMDYETWLRATDGSAPTRLGPGMSFGLSPDGEWALASIPSPEAPLTLLPTGPGTPRGLPGSAGVLWAAWLHDGNRVVWASSGPRKTVRLHIQNIDGGEPRQVFDGPLEVGPVVPFRVSPDDRWVAAREADGAVVLCPLEDGAPRKVAGSLPDDQPSSWTEDGKGLFVSRVDDTTTSFFRLDLDSGARKLVCELRPRDPAGIVNIHPCIITPDGEGFAYSYLRQLDTLYLVTGLD
jgi:hypothetical protein